jgi:hypothetical protein
LAYSFSSNSQKDDNNSYENESEDDFHSASSNSTYFMTCSSQVQEDNGTSDDGAEEKDSQEDDYDREQEDADDEDLSDEVITEGTEEEYFECIAKSNEEQSETENPPVPSSITIEIDGHHDYDHEDADDDLSRHEVAVLGGQEEYFECAAESDDASFSANSSHHLTTCYDHEDANDEDHSSREVVAGGQEEYYDCASGSNEKHSETKNPPVPSITIEFVGHHGNQEDSQADENYGHYNQDNLSFDDTKEQSKCADDEEEEDTNESEAENPRIPSITDIEPLGLDRVFDNLGKNVLSMSSFRLRGLPRINYKE